MVSLGELKKDLEELITLESQATRQRSKNCLQLEQARLNVQISQLETVVKTPEDDGATTKPVQAKTVSNITKDLCNYAWDQSDKFMKIYLTLNGVQNIPKSNITCDFKTRSIHLKVHNLENTNYSLHVAPLNEEILSEGSHFKVKTDAITIFMKKETSGKTWPYIKQKETTKKAPKSSEPKDPDAGMMDMLKNMYDEGDDEMKRTIAKAYSESQSGKRGGPQGEPPL